MRYRIVEANTMRSSGHLTRVFFAAMFLVSVVAVTAYSQVNDGTESGQFFDNSPYYLNKITANPGEGNLGSFGNVPINYYTGMPQVSLDLLVLRGRGFALPVTISYDASGVKTDDLAGPVGLKWFLSAGGSIERIMKGGLPDESTNGYLRYSTETGNFVNISAQDWVGWSEKGEKDSEPDQFLMRIPGRSIKFYFDKDLNAVLVPRTNVQIVPTILNQKIVSFKVVTDDGITYEFGGDVNTTQERKAETFTLSFAFDYDVILRGYGEPMWRGTPARYNGKTTFKTKVVDFYNAKWFLKKVTTSDNEVFQFSYSKTGNVTFALKPSLLMSKQVLQTLASEVYNYIWYCCVPCPNFCAETAGPFYNVPALRKFASSAADLPPCDPFDTGCLLGDRSVGFGYYDPDLYSTNPGSTNINHTLITESNIKLTQVAADNGNRLVFTSSARGDLPNATKYDGVDLYQGGVKVRAIKFNYAEIAADETNDAFWVSEAFFVSKISSMPGTVATYWAPAVKNNFSSSPISDGNLNKFVYEGLKSYNYNRLFLESIQDITYGTAEPILYKFSYKEPQLLKRRTTINFDRFGFQADVPSGNYPLPGAKFAATGHLFEILFPANASFDIGMLSKVVYETGGSTNFVYARPSEAGIKVSNIRDLDEYGNLVREQEVEYFGATPNSSLLTKTYRSLAIEGTDGSIKFEISSTSNQNDSFTLTQGAFEGHTQVKVYNGTKAANNGYEMLTYQSPANDEFKDVPTQINSIPTESAYPPIPILPFPQNQDRDHFRGLLKEKKVFSKNSAIPEAEISYTYVLNPGGYAPKSLVGFKGASFEYSGTKKFWNGWADNAKIRYRYARYNIVGDWVVLASTKEVIRDQTNSAKTTTKKISYLYDPQNLQVSETKVELENNPSYSLVTRTKYVTHSDYDLQANGSSAQAQAIHQLRTNFQLLSPVETQAVVYNPVQQVLSAQITKYAKIGSGTLVKPTEIWALNSPTFIYASSRIDGSGNFVMDNSNFRKVFAFDHDAASGNVKQQTSLGGLISSYTWDATNSYVKDAVINPGANEMKTQYEMTQNLIGLKSVTDANGQKQSFAYDGRGRLSQVFDHQSNLTAAYRYQTISERKPLIAAISLDGQRLTGTSIYFSVPIPPPDGQTTFTWDFGNGVVQSTNIHGIRYTYTTKGIYTVKVTISNPEYGTAVGTNQVTIYHPIAVNACVDGPVNIDLCGVLLPGRGSCTIANPINNNSPTKLKATATEGCSSYTFVWQYLDAYNNWIQFGSGPETDPPSGFVSRVLGSYTVRCVVTDQCGNRTESAQIILGIYKSRSC